jgi:two-component system response regulator PilR (NtrC family)
MALSAADVIRAGDLSLERLPESERGAPESLPEHLDAVERKAILDALGKTGFNRTAAARQLGITFRALRYRMQRLGIRDPESGGGAA